MDEEGRRRPEWAAAVAARPLPARPAPDITRDPDWPARVRRMAAHLDPVRRPVAVAAVAFGPAGALTGPPSMRDRA